MSDNNEIILEVKNLNISFGKPKERTYVVQDLSFDLYKGETLGIVGESGCGKSTSVLALMGLLDKTAEITGTFSLCGTNYDFSRFISIFKSS